MPPTSQVIRESGKIWPRQSPAHCVVWKCSARVSFLPCSRFRSAPPVVLHSLIQEWFGLPCMLLEHRNTGSSVLFPEPHIIRWVTSNQPEMQSSLDSNSFRFWKYVAFTAIYSLCIPKMTSCFPQNVSGILFLSNTPPTSSKRQNIIPSGHWESAHNTENVANFPLDAHLVITAPPLKDNTFGTLQSKVFEKFGAFLIPMPAMSGLIFKDITEF